MSEGHRKRLQVVNSEKNCQSILCRPISRLLCTRSLFLLLPPPIGRHFCTSRLFVVGKFFSVAHDYAAIFFPYLCASSRKLGTTRGCSFERRIVLVVDSTAAATDVLRLLVLSVCSVSCVFRRYVLLSSIFVHHTTLDEILTSSWICI